jgi:hypothetical protein
MASRHLVLTLAAGLLIAADRPKDRSPAVKEPALRRELLAMAKQDQDARFAYLAWTRKKGVIDPDPKLIKDPKLAKEVRQQARKFGKVDHKNRKRMKQIVARYGWPGKGMVGRDGANAAWLLVQHADDDRPFQKRCLALMKAAPKGEVEPQHVAYLTDRVLVGDKKKQFYGTQCRAENGKFVPLPIKDPANVDKRRAAVGLPPLAEYLKQMQRVYAGGKAQDAGRAKPAQKPREKK